MVYRLLARTEPIAYLSTSQRSEWYTTSSLYQPAASPRRDRGIRSAIGHTVGKMKGRKTVADYFREVRRARLLVDVSDFLSRQRLARGSADVDSVFDCSLGGDISSPPMSPVTGPLTGPLTDPLTGVRRADRSPDVRGSLFSTSSEPKAFSDSGLPTVSKCSELLLAEYRQFEVKLASQQNELDLLKDNRSEIHRRIVARKMRVFDRFIDRIAFVS